MVSIRTRPNWPGFSVKSKWHSVLIFRRNSMTPPPIDASEPSGRTSLQEDSPASAFPLIGFWRALLEAPKYQISGTCNHCGLCEH